MWQAHPRRGQSPGRYGRIVALAVCIVRPDNDNRRNGPKTILNRPPDIVGRGRSRFLPAESAELRPTSATYMQTCMHCSARNLPGPDLRLLLPSLNRVSSPVASNQPPDSHGLDLIRPRPRILATCRNNSTATTTASCRLPRHAVKMTTPSPATRTSRYPRANPPTPSPASSSVADFLSPDRNSETNHKDALAAAAAEHERIRAKA